MTLIEHLEELRRRIVISAIAYVAATIVAFVIYEPILDLLKSPLDSGGTIGDFVVSDLFVSGIATAFTLRMKVSLFAGVILALPVLLFQVWRFVTPGLERNEKRYALPFVASSVVLFAIGTWVAFLVLPTGIHFLLGFTDPAGGVKPLIFLAEYLSFVMKTILAFGLSFEFPLLLIFLALAGAITSQRLRKMRRGAVVVIAIVGAVATPSQDPLSMIILAAPLYLLFELSILVIRFGLKR